MREEDLDAARDRKWRGGKNTMADLEKSFIAIKYVEVTPWAKSMADKEVHAYFKDTQKESCTSV